MKGMGREGKDDISGGYCETREEGGGGGGG